MTTLVFSNVIHKTKPLDIFIGQRQSSVVFNVIKSPSNPIILSLSLLERYNPIVHWNEQKIVLESNKGSSMMKRRTPPCSLNIGLMIAASIYKKVFNLLLV